MAEITVRNTGAGAQQVEERIDAGICEETMRSVLVAASDTESALASEPGEFCDEVHKDSAPTRADATSLEATTGNPGKTTDTSLGWAVYGLRDARKGTWEKPLYVVEDLIPAQCGVLVSAHPHAMKSLAWLQAAIEAPAKGTVWTHFAAPGIKRTLFIETEDPAWLLEERIRGLAKGLGIPVDEQVPGFKYVATGPFDLVKQRRAVEQLFETHQPQFAVISTLQNIIPGRSFKEQEDMSEVNALIVFWARKYCPIVMITHAPWGKRDKRAIGSITQTANYAVAVHFEKQKGGERVLVTLDSKLGSDDPTFALDLQTELVKQADPSGASKQVREVRRLVYANSAAPKKAKAMAALQDLGDEASTQEVADKAGVSPRYVRKLKEAAGGGKKKPKSATSSAPSSAPTSGNEGTAVPPPVPQVEKAS